jgi:lysyl-tRNA synthetase class 2
VSAGVSGERVNRLPDRFVDVTGRLVLLGAWWSLLRLLVHHGQPLDVVDDVFALVNLPVGPSLFSAVLLFIVGGAVRRRMRAAWWLLVGFQAVSVGYTAMVLTRAAALAEFTEGVPTRAALATSINAVLTVAALVMLVFGRTAFTAPFPAGARTRALLVLTAGIAVVLTTSLTLTWLAPGTLSDGRHRVDWAVRVVFGLRPDRSDVGWAGQSGHPWVAEVAGLLSGLVLIAAAVVFVRARRGKEFMTAQDELALRGLLARHGAQDSLGYFATRRDKSVVFEPSRRAAITHRVVGGVSLVSADPIGPPSHWPDAIAAWLRESRAHGWYPAVLAASERGAHAYVAAGLKAIPMGDEAIIDTETFTLDGPAMASVRRAARRMRRLGYTITVYRHADLSPDALAELADCAQRWRVDDTERGFSMALGRLGDPLDGRSIAVLAHDREGRLRGLLSLVPWGQRGVSLDLMRRDRTSDNGLNEAMVAALVRQARDELGISQVSLNFAMFRGVFSAAERIGAGPLVRLTCRAMRFAGRFWQLESLYRSNARYLPRWQTRYLCYDSPLTLARVSLAAGAAEGFVPMLGGRPTPRDADEPVTYDGRSMPLLTAVLLQDDAIRAGAVDVARPAQQQRARLAKLERLRESGMPAYPARVPRDTDILGLPATRPGERSGRQVSVVGRVRALRDFGGLCFAVLEEDGGTVQAMFARHELGAAHQLARQALDLGDLVSVTGEIVGSRHGETTVAVTEWAMAAKCLSPLPKLRASAPVGQRQVDLIVDAHSRGLLLARSRAVAALRETLASREFVEVETPMLQAVHGGANARPFVTHMNAHAMPLYLRIAPELALKRLCVAGFGRVYELNRNFRNEGVDDTHNPEFTSLEVYQAHADYRDMELLARDLVLAAAAAVHGSPVARRRVAGGGLAEVDLSAPWRSVRVHDAVSAACGQEITPDTTAEQLAAICQQHAIPARSDASAAQLLTRLYEQLVEACTVEPTFYYDFPLAACPLTRRHRDDGRLAERWDLVAWGQEIGTAYSELTDPLDQRERLARQSLQRAAGDADAMQVDEEFLAGLGYGMPPTGGLGLGVDRVLMMLTGATIKQTLAFPFPTRSAAATSVLESVVKAPERAVQPD